MARLIYCHLCAASTKRFNPTREDVAAGWRSRVVHGRARCPEGHKITVHADLEGYTNQTEEALPQLICDLCGHAIPDSAPIIAITEYRGPEPLAWEPGYMDLITESEWQVLSTRIKTVRARLWGSALGLTPGPS